MTLNEIVARCEKCGREFVWIPKHVKTDAFGLRKVIAGPNGYRTGATAAEVCGGKIVRLKRKESA